MVAWWPWLLVPLAGAITLLVTPFLRSRLETAGMLDLPGRRRSHRQPTPRGGGLAMAAGLLPVLTILAWLDPPLMLVPLLLTAALALVGGLDDRFGLSVVCRMAVQFFLAGLLLWSVAGVSVLPLGELELEVPWLWTSLAVVGVVWLINLHNFMDGSDGLASSQGAWCGLMFGAIFGLSGQPVLASASLSFAVVCLAFLIWNHPPARLFMGDSGSLLIGGVVSWMLLLAVSTGAASPWLGMIVASVFAVDATLTLLLRVLRGERWYTPHRQHAYQRLIACGWSHGQVLGLYLCTNLVLVLPITLAALFYPPIDVWLAGLLLALLAVFWAMIQFVTNGVQTAA